MEIMSPRSDMAIDKAIPFIIHGDSKRSAGKVVLKNGTIFGNLCMMLEKSQQKCIGQKGLRLKSHGVQTISFGKRLKIQHQNLKNYIEKVMLCLIRELISIIN